MATMTTIERPLTPEMRQALISDRKWTRVGARGGAALTRVADIASKMMGFLFLAVALLALGVLAVQERVDINSLLAGLFVLGIPIWMMKGMDGGKIRKAFEDHAAHRASQIERDLQVGVYLETVGDVGVKASFNEHVPHKLELPDRSLDVFDSSGTIIRLGLESPLRGVTVRYTPNAQFLFDISASDGRVLFKQA